MGLYASQGSGAGSASRFAQCCGQDSRLGVVALRSQPRGPVLHGRSPLQSQRARKVHACGGMCACAGACACTYVRACAHARRCLACGCACVQVRADAVESPVVEVASYHFCHFLSMKPSQWVLKRRAKAGRRDPCLPPSPKEAGKSPSSSPVPDTRRLSAPLSQG